MRKKNGEYEYVLLTTLGSDGLIQKNHLYNSLKTLSDNFPYLTYKQIYWGLHKNNGIFHYLLMDKDRPSKVYKTFLIERIKAVR